MIVYSLLHTDRRAIVYSVYFEIAIESNINIWSHIWSILSHDEFAVFFLSQQSCWLGLAAHLDQPRFHGVIVDQTGISAYFPIDCLDSTFHRRVDICSYLDALNDSDRLVLAKLLADLWQLDVNNFTKLRLGIVGDANLPCFGVRVEEEPFVTLGKLETFL